MDAPAPGADPAVVGPYLAEALADDAWRDVRVDLIAGGKSNLTYRLDSSAGSAILRRPPLGHVLPTAHDMRREHRVMSALCDSAVPVPQMLAFCADEQVLGAPFYVMQRIEGPIWRSEQPVGYADTPQERRLVGEGLVRVLADLHAVEPESVGLGDFGRPQGYLARQVKRWVSQWEATRIPGLEDLDQLARDLAASVPETVRTGIVHGDYRLDNTVLAPHAPGNIAAVLDWEMSTLGDPIADLGILLVYWAQADDESMRSPGVTPLGTALPGFPTRREVADLYGSLTGADLSALPWAVAFGFFKLAVVCAGIVARVEGGAMVGDGFDGIAGQIGPLVAVGRDTLASGEIR